MTGGLELHEMIELYNSSVQLNSFISIYICIMLLSVDVGMVPV